MALALLATLTACGGGGGGGGGSDPPPFRIALNASQLTWSYYEGNAPTQQTVSSTSTGTYNGDLYVQIRIENNGTVNAIDPAIPITVNGTQASAPLTPVANLAAGTYTGRVVLLACSDSGCANRVGGTPLAVNFTVNVLTPVRATPGALTKTVVSGTAVSEDIVVVPGANETGFTLAPALPPFVQVSNQSAGGFRLTLRSVPTGNYSGVIALTGSNGSRATFRITYTVTDPPGGQRPLEVSPSSFTFSTTEGATPAAQSLQVTEPTWRPGMLPPTVQYQSGQGWLNVADGPGGYRVTASAATLSAGTYTAMIFVTAEAVPAGIPEPFPTQRGAGVPVAITVGPGLVRPADIVRVIDSESALADLQGDVAINIAGGPPVTWHATSNVPWLGITNPDTMSGTPLHYSIDRTWLAAAQNFAQHQATISITAPGTPLTPTSFKIVVERKLAEVAGVGPHVVLAGGPATLVVSGRGFAAVGNLGARVALSPNLPPASIQLVNDNKLLLNFGSLNAGNYDVSVGNGLGIATSKGTVVGTFATPHPYATAAMGERLDVLVVDHEHGWLYGVRRDNGRLYRFKPGGPSGWTAEIVGPSAVDNVGVLFGGDLVVITRPGTLRTLAADTLAETFSLDLTCIGKHDYSEGGMPVTLDGRVWLARSTSSTDCIGSRVAELGAFDPESRAFTLFPSPDNTDPRILPWFTDGPDFAVIRTGDRVLMQTGYPPPLATHADVDVATATMAPIPAAQGWAQVSASDDGQRVLGLATWSILDARLALVGRFRIPDYQSPVEPPTLAAGVMAPDGKRAYVLAYRGFQYLPPGRSPRVYVLDTRASGDPLLLGYFELADTPGSLPLSAISLDGNTLFFAGDQRLVVTPIPSTLLQP